MTKPAEGGCAYRGRIGSSPSFIASSAKADQQARCSIAQPSHRKPRQIAGLSVRGGLAAWWSPAQAGSRERGSSIGGKPPMKRRAAKLVSQNLKKPRQEARLFRPPPGLPPWRTRPHQFTHHSTAGLAVAVSALRRGTQKTPARATLLAITNPQRCLPPEPSRRGGSREEPRWRQTARERGA
jgi:hypothetical protein